MDILWVVSSVVAGVSCVVLIGIIARHWTTLASIEVGEEKKRQEVALKEAIIHARLANQVATIKNLFKQVMRPIYTVCATQWDLFVRKIHHLEQAYERRMPRSAREKALMITQKLAEARECMDAEPERAEELFYYVLRLDAKQAQGYEGLAQLYTQNGDIEKAVEIYNFLAHLNPKQAIEYRFAMAKAYKQAKMYDKALTESSECLSAEPQSPRFLDFFIDLCIIRGDFREGGKALETLRRVNPENGNIEKYSASLHA